ncbi:MAG: molybdenum cofactor guanylyltransferase [Synergistaceae bacterium]|jgi:molybdopterin-guanine dinucleotide biosynthesis protein A|nr:molybdenum cofactor guanylyltransferase [Synergistaceae bacterium]
MGMKNSDVVGIVLAGGRSSRMGFDKGRIVLDNQGGTDLLTRTARLLDLVTGRVVVVGCGHDEFESWLDDVADSGPVSGLATALRRLGAPCLALACDMPFMDEATLRTLLDARQQRPPATLLTTYASRETGRMETLASVYEPDALEYFERSLDKGLLKLSLIVPEKFCHTVRYSSEEALPFFAMNSPSDLAAARIIASFRT